jgi:hypothetical protein
MRSLCCGRPTVPSLTLAAVGATLAAWLAIPRGALAQDDFAPSTLTLDRMDATHRVGVQLGFSKMPNVSLGDGFALRGELYGQFLLPGRALGFYGQMPVARTFLSEGLPDNTGIGNVEAGTFYLPTGTARLVLRGGLTFGTGSELPGATANIATMFERLTDSIAAAPRTTALRLSASTVRQITILFVRADLGLDVAISNQTNRDIYLRANFAAGLRLPYVDLSGELVNLGIMDGDFDSASDRFLHTFAVSLRTRGVNQLYLGYITPLDANLRGEIWTIALGYQRAFP